MTVVDTCCLLAFLINFAAPLLIIIRDYYYILKLIL